MYQVRSIMCMDQVRLDLPYHKNCVLTTKKKFIFLSRFKNTIFSFTIRAGLHIEQEWYLKHPNL